MGGLAARLLGVDGVRMSKAVSYTGQPGARLVLDHATELSASAAAYRCVQAITTNASSLDLDVVRDDDEVMPDHPIARLFNRRPNPLISARLFKEVLWAQLEWSGESFVYCDRGPTGQGEVQEVWPIFDPVELLVARGSAGADAFIGARVKPQGRAPVPLLPAEILWLRYPHPTQPWGALAPWRAASFAAELDAYAREWQKGELVNGARPDSVVYLGDIEEEAHNRAVEDFRVTHSGPHNTNKHLFLSGPVAAKVERLGLTPAEMSYLDSRVKNAEEIMLAFGVPKDYLLGGATYENRTASRATLWSDTIQPKLEIVASEVDRQLLPEDNETGRFNTSGVEALQESKDAQSRRAREQVYADIATLDEAREYVGLPPLPGGIGEMTLTAYRQQVRGEVGGGGGAPTPEARALVDELLSRERITLATRQRRDVARDPKAITKHFDRMEALGAKVVKRLAARQQKVVLRRLEQLAGRSAAPELLVRTPVDELYDDAYWRQYTRDAMESWVGMVYDGGAALAAGALSISTDLFDREVLAAMTRRLDVLADQVTATTRLALEQQLLQPGVAAGESIDDLAARIKTVFTDLETWRGEMIARTETIGGSNEAGRLGAVASGVVKARRWLATSDDRTRESHVELNGYVTQGLDDPYPNGLLFPGDPNGSGGETINCRCTETWVVDEENE